ncbi:MAG: WYL domain-containing protein [Sulfurimonas sp.]|nr:WYL domain-containing protein [Sulfurimonas sp.]
MKWSTQQRIEFIETRLFWEGKITRKDLIDFFGISEPQATKDIREYIIIAENNVLYDHSIKQYVTTPNFTPKISAQSSEKYLNMLKLIGEKEDKFFNGIVPSFSVMPMLRRFVDTEMLKRLLKDIRDNNAIKINYQSMGAPDPKERWITPHSLAYDSSRWHVRALCHNSKEYKDFNLGRILSINNSTQHVFDHSIDYEWHNKIDIIIAPNPLFSEKHKALVERDYYMEEGQIKVSLKAAFFFYFKYQQGFDDNKTHPPEKYPIVILNRQEIEIKMDLLKSMSKNKIKDLALINELA